MLASVNRFTAERRWIWPLVGIAVLWALLAGMTDRFSLHSLAGVAVSASFLLLPALGQMLVVTTGRGNIDLSIPSVVTLAAYVTVTVSGGDEARLPLTLAAVLGTALVAGAANAFLVVVVRIPAMIATLATGYILATATLLANRQVKTSGTADTLAFMATGRIAGIPVVLLVTGAVALIAGYTVARAAYGRRLAAVGQSLDAARLAGIRTGRTITIAFLWSAVLSAACGMLLSAYSGGAFLELGERYLLQSVGAVVLGGTLIAGGSATAFGTMLGAVFLILIVTTMQIAGLPPGLQDIVQGLLIILVLSAAGQVATRR